MDLPGSAEAVVIGGGVVGAATTYFLARAGVDVVLLEAGELASGTSNSCDGVLSVQDKTPGLFLRLGQESVALYRMLAEELEADFHFQLNGGIILIETPDQMEIMRQYVAPLQDEGLQIRLLDSAGVRDYQPALAPHVTGGSFCQDEGQVYPPAFAAACVSAAKRLGARAYTGTPVTGIEVNNGRVQAVVTPAGKVATPTVVNAAGVWSPKIGAMLGLDIPIKPRRGQLVVTERVKPIGRTWMIGASYFTAKYEHGSGGAEDEGKIGTGFVLEPTRDGTMLVGSSRQFAGYDKRVTAQATAAILAEATRIVPSLADLRVLRTYAGLRPFTPDHLPILGPVDGLEGFFMAAGHEGDGICLAPITGKLISEAVTTGNTSLPIHELRLSRFSRPHQDAVQHHG